MKILMIEDNESVAQMMDMFFKKEQWEVVNAYDGESGLADFKAAPNDYDIITLDLNLPKMDGMQVAQEIRKLSKTVPLIMLTARDTESDQVLGLELGADDYVTKPFSPREIVARIKAIERRVTAQDQNTDQQVAAKAKDAHQQLVVGEITIDEDAYQAFKNGERLALTPKEFELLDFFAKRVGKLLSRDALLNGVWGFEYPAETRMVDIQVSHLRDKIETDAKHPTYIKTVRGFGYQMEVPNE